MKTFLAMIVTAGITHPTIIRAESISEIKRLFDVSNDKIKELNKKEIEKAFRDGCSVVTCGLDDTPRTAEAEKAKDTIQKIEAIIEEAMILKNAYFYTPPSSAGARRYYESKHSHSTVEWTEGGDTYSARYDVTCSCRNIYANGCYTKNSKQTTLKAIRYSLARLKTALLLGEI